MLEDIYLILWNLADYIARLLRDFTVWLSTNLTGVLNWIQTAWAAAIKAINDALAFIKNVVLDLWDDLLAFAQNMISTITQAFQTAWGIVKDAVLGILGQIATFASNLFANIKAQISSIIDQVKYIFTSFIDNIARGINTLIQFVIDSYNEFVGAVTSGIASIVQFARDTWNQLTTVVSQAIQGLIEGPASIFQSLTTRFADLGTALRETIADVVTKLTNIPEELRKALEDVIDTIIGALLDWTNAPEISHSIDILKALTDGRATPADYQGFVGDVLKRFSPTSSLGRGIVFVLLTAVAALPAFLSIGSVYAQPMTQALAREFPYQLLAVPDVVAAWKRGLISPNTALDILKRHGFSEADAQSMFAIAETIPAEFDALAFYHRGLVSDGQLADVFKDRGFTATWAAIYKQASFVLPPIQDLIVMAVREVFSPDVTARFRQFEDFPEVFAEEAAKQGLSKEWALRYWAAHWALPSPMQGFEMYHRRIIERPDLELLLRSLDVMPFWRDALIQLAYNPYTRVDIRRMHQLGVLSDQEVLESHLDLGYSPDKAQKLTEFVLRLNAHAPGEDDAELGRLTRATVLGFYEDGILLRDRAGALLQGLGITPEAATLYLDSVDNDQQRKERKAQTDIIVAQATAGVITFAQAQGRLASLGLETGEIQKALLQLERAEQSRNKIPSLADGQKFLRLGLINGAQFFDLLLRLGYSNAWASIYLQAAIREAVDDKNTGTA